jgi:hypothetical protein
MNVFDVVVENFGKKIIGTYASRLDNIDCLIDKRIQVKVFDSKGKEIIKTGNLKVVLNDNE